ncbi:MAG: thioesterase family protein [Pseudomonadota bacterium]|jgi:Predicted thioesterase|nr:MAG: acyl-CoA thioesterase [Pseudomonadota bacterium]
MSESHDPPLTDWELPRPHVVRIAVAPEDIDAYGHVNNSVYLRWLDRAAWSHSAALGIGIEQCLEIRRGMAALRTEIDYVRAALPGDEVLVGTCIESSDRKLRVTRRFQVRRASDGATLARARIEYVCLNLDTGRATRMPEIFSRLYVP